MSQNTVQPRIDLGEKQSTKFDPRRLLSKAVSFLPWYILSLIVCIIVAEIYLEVTTPVYMAKSLVLIGDNEVRRGEQEILAGLNISRADRNIVNEQDIIKSYELMYKVVDSLNLDIEFVEEGRVRKVFLYGKAVPFFVRYYKTGLTAPPKQSQLKLGGNSFDLITGDKSQTYKFGDTIRIFGREMVFEKNPYYHVNPENKVWIHLANRRAVTSSTSNKVKIGLTREYGGVLELTIADQIPEKAVDVLNVLIVKYIEQGLSDKNTQANNSVKFLNERLASIDSELSDANNKVVDYKAKNRIASGDGNNASELFSKSNVLVQEISTQSVELEILKALEKGMQQSSQIYEQIPSALTITDASLMALIASHNGLVLQRKQKLSIGKEADPEVKAASAAISAARQAIFTSISNYRTGLYIKLDELNRRLNVSRAEAAAMPEKELRLLDLEKAARIKDEIFTFLLKKKEEMELSMASNVSDARVLEAAMNQGQISPVKEQILMLSIIVALIIPTIFLIIIELFNNTIGDRAEIESSINAPIVGEVMYKKVHNPIVIEAKSRTAIAEQFRLIRTNLEYIGVDYKIKSMLVTSYMSGEGKSFFSLNLAASVALLGKKVLIIELDLRKPRLSKELGIENKSGLTNYLIGTDLKLENLTIPVPGSENLDLLPSGIIPPNPSEIILSDKMVGVFKWINDNYDFVVIDSAPVGLVTDALLLDKFVDFTFFIIRHKFTYKASLGYIDKIYNERKFKNMGIVVNGIRVGAGENYGYGYGYGYGNGYGYGYGYGNKSGSGYYAEDGKKEGVLRRLINIFKVGV